jgi:hypothetical protein
MVPVQFKKLIGRDSAKPKEKRNPGAAEIFVTMGSCLQKHFLDDIRSINAPLQPRTDAKTDYPVEPNLMFEQQCAPSRDVTGRGALQKPVRFSLIRHVCHYNTPLRLPATLRHAQITLWL